MGWGTECKMGPVEACRIQRAGLVGFGAATFQGGAGGCSWAGRVGQGGARLYGETCMHESHLYRATECKVGPGEDGWGSRPFAAPLYFAVVSKPSPQSSACCILSHFCGCILPAAGAWLSAG